MNKGIDEGVDINQRYNYFAQAEALLIYALVVPCYIGPAKYQASKFNVFEGNYAACGYASKQYKGMHLLDHFISMDEYEQNLEDWLAGKY